MPNGLQVVAKKLQGAMDWLGGKKDQVVASAGGTYYTVPGLPGTFTSSGDAEFAARANVSLNNIVGISSAGMEYASAANEEARKITGYVNDPVTGLAALAALINTNPDAVVEDWNTQVAGGFSGLQTYSLAMQNMGVVQEVVRQYVCWPLYGNHNIWINVDSLNPEGNAPEIQYFPSADPSSKLSVTESDYAMLVRLYPTAGWLLNYAGGPFCGCQIIDGSGGVTTYIYVPRSPTLLEFFHLFDYTPSSGPPVRNGITDLLQQFALVPIVW